MIGFTFPESDSELVIHTNPSIPDYDFSFLVKDVEKVLKEHLDKGYKVEMDPIEVRPGKYAILLESRRKQNSDNRSYKVWRKAGI
jgi:hypothetical protein